MPCEPLAALDDLRNQALSQLAFGQQATVVAAPPHHLNFNVADILQKVQERIAQGRAQGQLPRATIINAPGHPTRPHDPRPPRLAVVSDLPGESETKPT
jgi:hypothetical protein